MPIQIYECPACKVKTKPARVKMDAPAPECECGAKMRRAVARSSFSLQGGGWYKQGYAG